MVAATSRSWEVTACEARRWALSGDRFTQPAWRREAGTVTTPFPTKGRPAQGARVVCARARGQDWQDWNTRPDLHWSETRAWLLLLPRPEEEGTRGQRQAVGDPRARGGTRRQLWGGRLPCGSWQAGSPAGVRPCGTPRQLVPVSQEEAVGPAEPASPLPAATALTKGGRETRPRHQVTGRETSVWSLALLSSAHTCEGTHETQGEAGHQGAAMTQAIPASLELVGERRHSHPSGSQKPGSHSVGGRGKGTRQI